jgi:outer membrane receptor for ferrienterochelin and colicins
MNIVNPIHKNIFLIFYTFSLLGLWMYSSPAAEIKGQILDENRKFFPGADVFLEGTILGATTDLNGIFRIENVPQGKFMVTMSVLGYFQQTIPVNISQNRTYDLGVFTLSPSPIPGEPVVVTASKYRQNVQDVPVSISSFSQKDIIYRNSITVDEALQYVSGINMNSSQINIRGSSGFSMGVGSRVLLLLDGTPFLTGDTRDIIYESIPTYLVDHVEVLKGAGSALYGSSALGGVVNIITRDFTGSGSQYFVKLYGGLYSEPSFEQWKWTDKTRYMSGASFAFSHKRKNLGIGVGGSRDQDDGYRQNDWFRRYSGSGKIQWSISPYQQLTVTGNYMTKKRGNFLYWRDLNHALQPPVNQTDDWVTTHRGYLNSHYRYIFNQKQFLIFRGIWFWNKVEDNVSDGETNKALSNNLNFELQFNSQLGKIYSTSGVEGTINTVNSDMFGDRSGAGIAIYSQGEYPLSEKLKSTLGIRFDYFSMDSLESDHQLNPKFGLVYKAIDGGIFRTSFGLGFRAPSMAEAFTSTSASGFRVIPNLYLKPEKSIYYEVGWNQILSSWLTGDIAFFYSQYTDLIEGTVLKTVQIQFQNITKARIRGTEFSLKGQLFDKKLLWGAAYTYVDPWDMAENRFLNFRPRHLIHSFAQTSVSFLNMGMDYRYISKYDRIDERLSIIIPDAKQQVEVHMFDLHLAASFKFNHLPLRAALQINNLLRYNYIDLVGALAPLQNYVFSLQTDF